MKVEVKEIYKCDYCNKIYQVKGAAEKHEKACSKNPDNHRACFTCTGLEKRNTELSLDFPFGTVNRGVVCLFCTHKNIYVYPPKVEHKGNAFDLGDDFNDERLRAIEKDYIRQGDINTELIKQHIGFSR